MFVQGRESGGSSLGFRVISPLSFASLSCGRRGLYQVRWLTRRGWVEGIHFTLKMGL